MTREVSRFGHAAKVWLVILILGYLLLILVGPHRFDDGWTGFIEVVALWTVVVGLNLWINVSQRVWYDDQQVCTWILGKGRQCICYSDIQAISASHSWKRAAAQRPISELQISAKGGRHILISLRHLSLSGLQEMVDEIHRRTGLPVPDLRKS